MKDRKIQTAKAGVGKLWWRLVVQYDLSDGLLVSLLRERMCRMLRLGIQVACVAVVCCGVCVARGEDQLFDSNGVKIRYVVEGEGEAVVLVHGFSGDLDRNWRGPGLIAALAKGRKVIAYDQRGHGKSEKPHDPKVYGMEMVEDVVRLMDNLKIQRAHVVGYSMGATITNKLLTTHPERLLSATLGGGAAALEGAPPVVSEELASDVESGKGMGRLILALTPRGEPMPTEAQIQAINERFYASNDGKALAAVLRGLANLHVAETTAKANKLPVLGLIGSRDPLKVRMDAMSARLTGMTTYVVEGGDHMTTFVRPEFGKELVAFLDKHKSN